MWINGEAHVDTGIIKTLVELLIRTLRPKKKDAA
jgi:hypothetical protein